MTVVGRLAPSPTGAQHLGNARTYLIAWLSARSQGGRVVLRIEDIDSPRIKPTAIPEARADLAWLGLDTDGEELIQTQRLEIYLQALGELQRREIVYPCTCTRADIERAASAPHLEHEGPTYPGTCASRKADDPTVLGQPHCWRFRLPDTIPSFMDHFSGECSLDLHSMGGDFVVWKSTRSAQGGSTPAYQLAVVVDDAAQGVTEVIRGDDLIPSTPRQLLLYEALNLRPPTFAHVPLVVGSDGRRLAKRHGDTRLSALRAAGVSAERVLGFLGWSCGWLQRGKEISAKELLPRFTLKSIPPEPFVVTPELLGELGYRV